MRPNRHRLPAVVLVFAVLLGACGSDDPSTASDPTGAEASTATDPTGVEADPEVAAPEGPRAFTAPLLGGGELASTSFTDEATVLWFWAPWCTVCRAEADDVVAAAAALDGEVDIIGVAGRGEVADMEEFVADTGTGGLPHVVDADGSIWSSYEVYAQPAYAFIDEDGEVEVFVGALGEEALVERMTELAEA